MLLFFAVVAFAGISANFGPEDAALTHETIACQKPIVHKALLPDKSLLRQYFTQLHA